MKIDATGGGEPLQASAGSAVETLQARVLQATGLVDAGPGSKRADAEFEWHYRQLLAMEGQGRTAIYDYLRALPGADGTTPAYPTARELLAVTLKVLVRLTDDRLQDSLVFHEVRGANGLAFSLDLFVKSMLREVIRPVADDAWEQSEW